MSKESTRFIRNKHRKQFREAVKNKYNHETDSRFFVNYDNRKLKNNLDAKRKFGGFY